MPEFVFPEPTPELLAAMEKSGGKSFTVESARDMWNSAQILCSIHASMERKPESIDGQVATALAAAVAVVHVIDWMHHECADSAELRGRLECLVGGSWLDEAGLASAICSKSRALRSLRHLANSIKHRRARKVPDGFTTVVGGAFIGDAQHPEFIVHDEQGGTFSVRVLLSEGLGDLRAIFERADFP